jgi:hypothetical protein
VCLTGTIDGRVCIWSVQGVLLSMTASGHVRGISSLAFDAPTGACVHPLSSSLMSDCFRIEILVMRVIIRHRGRSRLEHQLARLRCARRCVFHSTLETTQGQISSQSPTDAPFER